jgi:hypothetical protein
LLGAPATGGTTALILLARDLYYLQLVHRIPAGLVDRLRNHHLFQGARYEAAIAAALLLGGFNIEWISDKTKSHCEFYAVHKFTHDRIAVEAKSRHRPGVLNAPGEFDPTLSGDVSRLFKGALDQAPGDAPFAVFVDLNLPHDRDLSSAAQHWGHHAAEIMEEFGKDPTHPADFAIATFTNFGVGLNRYPAFPQDEPEVPRAP